MIIIIIIISSDSILFIAQNCYLLSEANKTVTELNLYTEEVVKEECLNHEHKRIYTALINLTKGKKIGGYGYGRLIKEKTIKFYNGQTM